MAAGYRIGPDVECFFDQATSTFTYLVIDPTSRRAAVIDPVLDFDLSSATISTHSADRVLRRLRERECSLDWILETHAHADHLTAAAHLKQYTGARVAIGAGVRSVQNAFAPIFGMSADFNADPMFDRLWDDGDTLEIGGIKAVVMATPGHTSDSVTYVIGGCAFVGDSLFLPERGTARCDFPGGDVGALYGSVQSLYRLPDDTRLYVGHDYPPQGSEPKAYATVRQQKAANVHIRPDTARESFMVVRRLRDAALPPPHLLIPALQVNICGGRLPPPDVDGRVRLRLPVNVFADGS